MKLCDSRELQLIMNIEVFKKQCNKVHPSLFSRACGQMYFSSMQTASINLMIYSNITENMSFQQIIFLLIFALRSRLKLK